MSTTKTVNVTTGKVLHYTITKSGYKPVSGSKLITGSETINVNMVPESSSDGVYTFGDRIGGCATFFQYFDSINPTTNVAQKYACFILDAAYRRYGSTPWGPNDASFYADLPVYGYGHAEDTTESATYVTNYVYDNVTPSASSYQLFYYARNPGGNSLIINVNGVNYVPQVPNIRQLMTISSYYSQLDALDPTAAANPYTNLTNIMASSSDNRNRAWSSTAFSTGYAWSQGGYNGTNYEGKAYDTFTCVPIFEIPVN